MDRLGAKTKISGWIKQCGSCACQHVASTFSSSPFLSLALLPGACHLFTLTARRAFTSIGQQIEGNERTGAYPMLSQEENDLLTRVGPATPTGQLLRRYWHVVAAASELSDEKPKKRLT